ncbi:hypothetical protein PPL_04061 [Heterostelium album PN500]|uniref:Peptidase M66 domain-containing protein n=1 Tax=Heterostelium pallidum (strain ATCC 26659 / Pp 5 / PN500) TaxID=670386 RepID=D3B5X3_HETP5|nr:hypothetical protein PPL_04061 [Heterostelium album PN500]EFA83271.1 hypothetical protein PPL_04061 [Heterostelium album PN500]|eukprot:XP_020435388.1 hypothetical protein PPL_04061 [Heterostelium album PN500]
MVWYTNKIIIIPTVVVTVLVILAIVLPTSILLPKKSDTQTLTINQIHFVQTHVLPPQGLNWTTPNGGNVSYHLTGQRQTMILIKFDQDVVGEEIKLQIWVPTVPGSVGNETEFELATVLPLEQPDMLPPTESNGTIYANNTFSVQVLPQYIVPGMKVVAGGHGFDSTDPVFPVVGMNSVMRLPLLPFYLFGANDSSIPYNVTTMPPESKIKAIYQTWPVSVLDVYNHPAGIVKWKTVSLGAGDGGQAYLVKGTNQIRSGFVLMGAVLGFLSGFQGANGDGGQTNNLIYAPLIGLNTNGFYTGPGGGLGGGSRGTGDYSYTGIFIHEMGHAWGLPHSGEAYTAGTFPYAQGSLNGSVWGFDFDHQEFLSTCIPTSSGSYKNCNSSHVVANGCCIRQDPMQGGSGDQSKGYPYTLFPDFDMGRQQMYMEGTTTLKADGNHSYSGGRIIYVKDTDSYIRWDSIDNKYVPYIVTNGSKGMDMYSDLPVVRDVDVYTIFIHWNNAPTSVCKECTQVYDPLKYKGNLLFRLDPTIPENLKLIKPNTGALPWFCHSSGCDFTFRVTYTDGFTLTKLLQRGVRSWFSPTGQPNAEYADPMDGNSLMLFSENVPADRVLSKVELLWTPFGAKGLNDGN